MSKSFRFKQFTIQQDKCAMKVGTDGVLLGAWISPVAGNLLDIGCGTGLLSLMMAQRVEAATIDAIDIEESAYLQSIENVEQSKWEDRIHVFHTSLQQCDTSKKYDLIFSNPPYFVQSTNAPDKARHLARHTDNLPFLDLIEGVKRLMSEEGVFALILPIIEAQQFICLTKEEGLFLNRKCEVKPNFEKAPKRMLMEFSFLESNLIEEELTIETDKRHHYTKEYITLTQDFYLYDR